MIISHKHKFISLDPPKTGTAYRQKWLSPFGVRIDGLQHANLTEINQQLKDNFNDYFVFAFVRNPWARYLSWFSFLNRDQPKSKLTPESFNQFMDSYFFGAYKDSGLRITLPQSFWFLDSNINFVGSLENIYTDLQLVLDDLKLFTALPEKLEHESKHKLNLNEFYNNKLIDFVADHEKEVIKLKGYNFS